MLISPYKQNEKEVHIRVRTKLNPGVNEVQQAYRADRTTTYSLNHSKARCEDWDLLNDVGEVHQ